MNAGKPDYRAYRWQQLLRFDYKPEDCRSFHKAIEQVVPCQRIGVAVVGLEVPHTHIHLFPLNSMADFGFGKEPVGLSSDEMAALATAIGEKI